MNQSFDEALNGLPDGMIDDCHSFIQRSKKMKNKKKLWLTIGSAAACLCLVACIMVGIFIGKGPEHSASDLVFEHTDNFPSLFFDAKSKGEAGTPAGIWANPVRVGDFRTSVTLGAELDKAKASKIIAVKVNFAVSEDDTDGIHTAYEFFKAQGLEAGILGDGLYLAATKAQLVSFLQGDHSDAAIGAEFQLANPTEAQKDIENGIRY